ncbi:pyrimidine-nucleoside phosphorylase [Parasporobacterium paucivorans]|nr:pyrimidine-nucleoside phosphorylase [Parasporobacterium paucivorans]
MRMIDLIQKKRDGEILSKEEIGFIVTDYTEGRIPDYQMSAFLMAVYFRGMTEDETIHLTMAMANSGEIVDLSGIDGIKVDKHSTGGVGDKTSLALGPMVAACGVPVAKMSGRGLGHTGGTIDKLESFRGFSTEMSPAQFVKNVNEIKISIIGQSKDLAPADKKIYALRDVTATVDQISLIASSIMSKKLAAGADAIVLDVKVGNGAFMEKEDDAIALAREMVEIGNGAGRNTIAIISDMNQPLGRAVGNALEVREAIETLAGEGDKELRELCLTLGSYMLLLARKADTTEEARVKLENSIRDKSALRKLAQFIEAQGGDSSPVFDTARLPSASIIQEIKSEVSGYVCGIKTSEIGLVSLALGGGRETKESVIDLSVGVVLSKKIGDWTESGETIAVMHGNDPDKVSQAARKLLDAYSFSDLPVEKPSLIKWILTKDGIHEISR